MNNQQFTASQRLDLANEDYPYSEDFVPKRTTHFTLPENDIPNSDDDVPKMTTVPENDTLIPAEEDASHESSSHESSSQKSSSQESSSSYDVATEQQSESSEDDGVYNDHEKLTKALSKLGFVHDQYISGFVLKHKAADLLSQYIEGSDLNKVEGFVGIKHNFEKIREAFTKWKNEAMIENS